MTLKTVTRIEKLKLGLTGDKLAKVGYPVFLKNTPIDTGNAVRHTFQSGNEIRAEYPYAVRLDDGWSKKKPNGMTKPTIDAIRQYIRKLIG